MGLYGEDAANHPDSLSEAQKENIRNLSAAVGAFVGGVGGDSGVNAQIGGVVAQNAVENNYLSAEEELERLKAVIDCSKGNQNSCIKESELGNLSLTRIRKFNNMCNGLSGSAFNSCESTRISALRNMTNTYDNKWKEFETLFKKYPQELVNQSGYSFSTSKSLIGGRDRIGTAIKFYDNDLPKQGADYTTISAAWSHGVVSITKPSESWTPYVTVGATTSPSPSISVTRGYISGTTPKNAKELQKDFLAGNSASTTGCINVVCVGGTFTPSGGTSFEYGLSFPPSIGNGNLGIGKSQTIEDWLNSEQQH
nr:VENN motif pre-toxin domain-containing protein [Uruburuella testudinis]